MTVFRRTGTRVVRVLRRAGLEPGWGERYELSRMQTPRDCSRKICLAVKRSTTRIAPPQAGHRQAPVSLLADDTAAVGAAASNVRQRGKHFAPPAARQPAEVANARVT